ncbi:baseplate J/gp47 family protein [uncultured Methanobrevibacter sp.]|uniref:baseplate J/gp47 family protein n=1 Tax=uncultured Methanobrevibacter sp. TaxID=253161 RepID=UPI0026360E83|nr:baseplate J/gp47 family protein [uncultured Methanobrevibacter sp.]
MNFNKKEYEEIFKTGLQNAYKQKLISRSNDFLKYINNREDIENFYVMILSVHAEWLDEVYEEMQLVYDSTYISKATGIDLDHIGEWLGIPRAGQTRSYVDVVLTLSREQDEDITIPPGALTLSTKQGVLYKNSKTIYIPRGKTSVTASAYSVNKGPSTKISENTLTLFENNDYGLKKCNNPLASTGGEDIQTDEEYRDYLKNWSKILQKGNNWAYKNYFRNCDGLDSYHLIPCWDGTGTIKIVIDANDESTSNIKQEIYNNIQENIALYDDDIQVMNADKKEIPIYAVVNVDIDQINPYSRIEKDEIKTKIRNAISIFINGGYKANGSYYKGLVIGEDFIPHKLAVFVDNEVSELKDINIKTPSAYVEISDEEIGVSNNIIVDVI